MGQESPWAEGKLNITLHLLYIEYLPFAVDCKEHVLSTLVFHYILVKWKLEGDFVGFITSSAINCNVQDLKKEFYIILLDKIVKF